LIINGLHCINPEFIIRIHLRQRQGKSLLKKSGNWYILIVLNEKEIDGTSIASVGYHHVRLTYEIKSKEDGEKIIKEYNDYLWNKRRGV